MSNRFFNQPVLNSPYHRPNRHWELDEDGQPTQEKIDQRRQVEFISATPNPKGFSKSQDEFAFDERIRKLKTRGQQYELEMRINSVRQQVERWRNLPNPSQWRVTPETARLLKHWRNHNFADIRPFFCQVEAVETAIWLTEVAPSYGKVGKEFLDHLEKANNDANPGLPRLALKLATGTGKTMVMAMLIIWQTINAVRHPQSRRFTRGFLVVTPGITIKDRLRVLQPNDPDSYYQRVELVPSDMLQDLEKARIVITNYHAFKRRERLKLPKGSRSLLQGRGDPVTTQETDGQMLQRVMPELMGAKRILVLNDEAHHCYREKPGEGDEGKLTGDDRKEANKNQKAARLWISGLETLGRKLGISRVMDLSATPFFLRGSGYREGTLFPWTMSDFSLMDAIECGIVKLPRVPVADNVPGGHMPKFRKLWEHIRPRMRRHHGDPRKLPPLLETALKALYGHYQKTFEAWKKRGINVPPCFIVVCNNISTSKLVFEYISGFHREKEDGSYSVEIGQLPLFSNFDEHGDQFARPRTLLINSEELESGDALSPKFQKMAAEEIAQFRREIIQRTGDARQADCISDQDLLREVTNTVGKSGRLGDSIRCVVSVSMLTEGWDANTVSHVLGIRAFGSQLLCEQVVGRALRRQSYTLNENGLFNVEYADVLGIPFDFTAKPVVATPKPPPETIQVRAVRPERDALEIRFPRVAGYRKELPKENLKAEFNEDSVLVLTTELTGPSITRIEGIAGKGIDLTLDHLKDRQMTLLYKLTKRLLYTKLLDRGEEPELHLFWQLKNITKEWLDGYLVCKGDTFPAQVLSSELADMACERITSAITRSKVGNRPRPVKAVLDPYNPTGSTNSVNFNTSKTNRYKTDAHRCHINWAVLDKSWEREFCRVVEAHPRVKAYVKNHGLGFEVPYRYLSESHTYIPDFIVLVDDGHGDDDFLHLIVEIKGYQGEDAKVKRETMDTYWVPGVNNLGGYGRWAFAEFKDVYEMRSDFEAVVAAHFNKMINSVVTERTA